MITRTRLKLTGAVFAIALLTAAILPDDRALLDAAKRGDLAAIRALLKEGADPNAAQGDGVTALHLTAKAGNVEIAKALIRAGAKVEAKTRIGEYTPLHFASEAAQLAVVDALLDAGADPSAVTTTSGVTPLHLAARALNGETTVRLLIERGAPVNARESAHGQTALMFAASAGHAASVRELMSHGADPSVATEVIDVVRMTLVDQQVQERVKQALKDVKDPTPAQVQAAITAARDLLSKEQIERVLETVDPAKAKPSRREELVGKTGAMTALMYAARDGRTEALEALLDGGADINQVSGDGSSPLVTALLNGQFDLGMVLIKRGADPNIVATTDGMSPLFAVIQTQWAGKFTNYPGPRAQERQKTEYLDVLSALLEAEADPNVRLKSHLWYWDFLREKMGEDFTGATPFWRAAFGKDVRAMKLLAEHGADPNIPTYWPDPDIREGRQKDGRAGEDSGLPTLPEGTPNEWPIHAAAGGGYLGLGAFMMNDVPDNFLNAVKYLVEEHGADVNLPDSWGYTPLHYAAVRGGNDVIEYLVSKGADVTAMSRLGQSAADMARGGRAGYFSRAPFPKTVELLQTFGAPFFCVDTHFKGTADWCAGSGVPPFEGTLAEKNAVK